MQGTLLKSMRLNFCALLPLYKTLFSDIDSICTNEQWYHQYLIKRVTVNLAIGVRPFYLPQEFCCILLFVVYISLSSKIHCAAAAITYCVCNLQQQFPGAPVIVLAYLNTYNLEKALLGCEMQY